MSPQRDLERERATWEARHLIIEKIREFYPEEVAQAEREVAAEIDEFGDASAEEWTNLVNGTENYS